MWNWSLEASVETTAKPEAVWKLWTNVEGWPRWDHELEWCRLDGPFKVGNKGKLKPKGWFASDFILTEVMENVGYGDITNVPLTQLIFKHRVVPIGNNRVRITHRVMVKGLLAPLFRLTLGKKLKHGLPKAVKKLADMAESI